jgi:hypothetical protein
VLSPFVMLTSAVEALPLIARRAPYSFVTVFPLLAGLGFSDSAQACGGLFCSNTNAVNQVAERIIFAQNDDQTITAVIEIQYQGPANEFAWVLPVPQGDVEVGVSFTQSLDALQAASNPVYNLRTTQSCPSRSSGSGADAGILEPAEGSPDPEVTVVSSGAVGPYDYAIIQVDDALDDRADVAVEWLGENGYDVAALGPDTLRPYLDQDMNLLAFRLQKEADSGSIRPVMITYPGTRPIIPIRPTAVAAQNDMGILVWLLGDGRGVPSNYLSLELNETRINWNNPSPTYDDVVIAAADEAGGWGFVTEQSGRAEAFAEIVYAHWKSQAMRNLRESEVDLSAFLQDVVQFGRASNFLTFQDGFMDIMADPELLPLRDGYDAEQLVGCVSCYFEEGYVEGDPIEALDRDELIEALDELLHQPGLATRKLFESHSRVTRLYTTLSPDEMTIDPEFVFNRDLDDVSNLHLAERENHCDDTWTVSIGQGHAVAGRGNRWPIAITENAMPYNARVLQLSANGNGEVLVDNTDEIASAIDELGVGPKPPKSEDGCSVRPQSRPAGNAGLLLVLGLIFSRIALGRLGRRKQEWGKSAGDA